MPVQQIVCQCESNKSMTVLKYATKQACSPIYASMLSHQNICANKLAVPCTPQLCTTKYMNKQACMYTSILHIKRYE